MGKLPLLVTDEKQIKKIVDAFFKVKNPWERIVLIHYPIAGKIELLRVKERET